MKKLLKLLVLVLIVVISGCKKDNEGSVGNINPVPFETNYLISVTGMVVNGGIPVPGATVTVNPQTATTDLNGIFVISNITTNSKRCVVEVSKIGYTNQLCAFHPTKNGRTHKVTVNLMPQPLRRSVLTTGGTLSFAMGGSLTFPANPFVYASDGSAYNHTASVRVVYLNQSDSLFSKKIPGGDLLAVNAANELKILESFGMVNVEITTFSGEKLQLAPGKKAVITFPVASSQLAGAPPVIPLWYLDEATAVWKEEGSATLVGSNYVGEVAHFTWWNCDWPYGIATVEGTVFSCANVGQPGVQIFARGYYTAVTDNMGEFICNVPANYTSAIDFNSRKSFSLFSSLISQTESVPILAAGQVYTLPNLVLGSSPNSVLVAGTVLDCNGILTSATVYVTDNLGNLVDFTYTSTGSYMLYLSAGSVNTITAWHGGNFGTQNIANTISSNCNTFYASPIFVCNSSFTGVSNFSYSMADSTNSMQTYNYHVKECSVSLTSGQTNYYIVTFTGYDSLHNATALCVFSLDTYSTGTFPWVQGSVNGFKIRVTKDGNITDMYFDSPGSAIVSNAPAVGENFVASFNGYAYQNSGNYPVTGFLDVLRSY